MESRIQNSSIMSKVPYQINIEFLPGFRVLLNLPVCTTFIIPAVFSSFASDLAISAYEVGIRAWRRVTI
jgi:hypothetical protein